MAREVAWTQSASNDLAEIAHFIGKDSVFYAAALVREFIAAGRSLDMFAHRGRIVLSIVTRRFVSSWSGIIGSSTRFVKQWSTYFALSTAPSPCQISRRTPDDVKDGSLSQWRVQRMNA